MRMWGYHVRTACCDKQALTSALACPPDIVVVEPYLNRGRDGWEVVRRIRAMQATPPCCIAVTTQSREADYSRSRQVGIECHLLKPTDPAELRSAMAGGCHEVISPMRLVPVGC